MGLDADNEAIQQLCYSYENNLLALKQALQLLDLPLSLTINLTTIVRVA